MFYPNYVDENAFIINYDLSGGERGERIYSYTADIDENANILLDPERIGYTFEGWLIGNSQQPKLSRDITIKDFKINGEYSDVTLKATWGNRPYVIDYDAQGGILTGHTSKQVVYNQKVGELPSVQKDGYEFIGWYYNGKLINENDLWDYPRDVTLTAKYLAKFKVKFSSTSFVDINDKVLDCRVVDYGSLNKDLTFEENEFNILEGQSLYTALGFNKMPVVAPIEQTGQTEYEFAGYWKWVSSSGTEYRIDSTTVFTLDIFSGVQGGETITLVPHCRKIWSPNA